MSLEHEHVPTARLVRFTPYKHAQSDSVANLDPAINIGRRTGLVDVIGQPAVRDAPSIGASQRPTLRPRLAIVAEPRSARSHAPDRERGSPLRAAAPFGVAMTASLFL